MSEVLYVYGSIFYLKKKPLIKKKIFFRGDNSPCPRGNAGESFSTYGESFFYASATDGMWVTSFFHYF